MHRGLLASLALVALIRAAPITEPTKTTENSAGDVTIGENYPKPTFILLPPITGPIKPSDKRGTEVEELQAENPAGDVTIGEPSYPKPTFILLPPITGPIKPSDKRDAEVKERQFSIGDPSTWWGVGGEKPPTPTESSTIGTPITGGLNPSNKRQTLIGGSDPTKARIVALELEYQTLLHSFGTTGPKPIRDRLQAIKDELLHKYGITIIESPDGTVTTFTPGKRDFTLPVGSFPGGAMTPEDPIPGGPMEPSN
ncbi:hypothetical protein F5B22DRAFT_221184 [Xylaria bambusicola]|uniref:uncharacterized protein n=1 Tax=Xylaria bambusicola TaxID=326684 RepID=UPI0020079BC8|nr:uncharacterized protein F5B22DRAFT_221184 [Xylaria bambusicola]KAI0514831.1 hypothetical protein F5B22DRAFT_221184 [Xylaria bambusicola]